MIAQNRTFYIAESLKIDKRNIKQYKKYLKENLTSFYEQLDREGIIDSYAIFQHKKSVEKHGDFDMWNFLILVQLKNKESGKTFLNRREKIKKILGTQVIRMELLMTTPESTYPIPSSTVQKRRSKPIFAVEYVDVQEEYLKEFQDIMIFNNGPAMKYIMNNAKWCHNFIALETIEVYYHNENYPKWNQLHVIGLYPESILFYKKDFSEGLDQANNISFDDNFNRLKEIRTMLYKTIGRKIHY
ncbi:hypothetical protein [Sporosalibacterium faouarense]|uniref:hypothetical protein n=1 Tax=Sporosalibacterium faouarense TaxID=516123 RepID=UPI00141CD935|nr:hypothetical protein [Sporosalibacterium faouarense]MTI46379.1 hypothetical protein [Bacillota bacterium]